VAVLVLAADIVTKATVVATLSDRAPVRLLGGLLTLRESRNPGAAFSIGPSDTILFTAIAVGVIIFIVRTARRIYSLPWAIALGLLLGGATGNLTDRIFRAPGPFRGWVVDWIQVPHWPVFNLADSAIVCGGALMVLLAARGHRLDAEPASAPPASSAPDTPGPDGPGPDGPGEPGPGASQRNGSQPDESWPAGPPPVASPSASASASAPEPASAQPAAAEQPREHPSGGGSG
jgi:signal peptidase II